MIPHAKMVLFSDIAVCQKYGPYFQATFLVTRSEDTYYFFLVVQFCNIVLLTYYDFNHHRKVMAAVDS